MCLYANIGIIIPSKTLKSYSYFKLHFLCVELFPVCWLFAFLQIPYSLYPFVNGISVLVLINSKSYNLNLLFDLYIASVSSQLMCALILFMVYF